MNQQDEKSTVIQEFFQKKTNTTFEEGIEQLLHQHLNNPRICHPKDEQALDYLKTFESIPENGWTIEQLMHEFAHYIVPHAMNTGSPSFIGHMASSLPNFTPWVGMLVNTLNQNVVKIETAKSTTPYERHAIAMVHELMYACERSFYVQHAQNADVTLGILTSGGTIANLTAIQCARNKAFQSMGNMDQQGIFNHQKVKPVVICSKLAHYSIGKVMSILGLGADNLMTIEVDEYQKMNTLALKQRLETLKHQPVKICALIGTAGTTECGSIDPLNELADLAEQYNIHFHVDAAWGGAVQFSRQYKHLLKGIERADSITIDGHKQLYLPMGLGMVVFKDKNTASFIEKQAEYIIRKNSEDLGRRSVEGSRPANVIHLQANLKLIGKKGFEALIDQGIQNARFMAQFVRDSEEFQLLIHPATNIVLYRYIPFKYRAIKSFDASQESIINAVNTMIQERQFKNGQSFISRTSIQLSRFSSKSICALRAVFANPLITPSHIEAMLHEQRSIAEFIGS